MAIEVSSQDYAGQNPHAVDAGTVAETLGVLVGKGLTAEEARKRLHDEGANRLTTDGGVRWYTILGRQVANSLTLVRLCDLLFATFWCDASVLCLFEELCVRCLLSPSEKKLIRSLVNPAPIPPFTQAAFFFVEM